jgi:hypothetical protein
VSGGDGKDIRFCSIEKNADGGGETLEDFNERREVFVWDKRESIIEISDAALLEPQPSSPSWWLERWALARDRSISLTGRRI